MEPEQPDCESVSRYLQSERIYIQYKYRIETRKSESERRMHRYYTLFTIVGTLSQPFGSKNYFTSILTLTNGSVHAFLPLPKKQCLTDASSSYNVYLCKK